MKALDYVSYLQKKFLFDDAESDLRWESFSPVFRKECRKAKLIADCGAEFGFYIHLVRQVNTQCRVVAFEPEPPRYDALKTFFKEDDLVAIYPQAVSNQGGFLTIFKTAGRSASVDANLSQWNYSEKQSIEVPACTLDTMFAENIPDIVKMDIEGAEVFALEGMIELLATQKPILFLEYHPQFIASIDPQGEKKICDILERFDYKIFNQYGELTDFPASRVILAHPDRAKSIEFDVQEKKPNRNLAFSRTYSRLYESVMRFAGKRVVVFGRGSFGNTVRALIADSVVRVVDSQSGNTGPMTKTFEHLEFDVVLITVLGREKEIVNMLANYWLIPLNKIVVFNVAKEPFCSTADRCIEI